MEGGQKDALLMRANIKKYYLAGNHWYYQFPMKISSEKGYLTMSYANCFDAVYSAKWQSIKLHLHLFPQ